MAGILENNRVPVNVGILIRTKDFIIARPLGKEIEPKYGNALLAKRNFEELKKSNEITEFSDIIFTTFVKEALVNKDGSLKFIFKTNVTLYAKID